jgi:hypothetical protein
MFARDAYEHSGGGGSMNNTGTNDSAVAQYVVENDGNKHSEHIHFIDAIASALVLRERQPHLMIKVRDLSQIASIEMNPEMAA